MNGEMGLGARLTRYIDDAARGIRRAPVEVLGAVAIALSFSWALEIADEAMPRWAEFAVACALVMTIAWTGTLLEAMGRWRGVQRWAFTAGGALVVAIYATAVADFRYEAEAWRAALLVGAAVMWLIALPAFAGPPATRSERMRRVDSRVLLRGIGASLYGAALFAGLALALRAIDVLFELGLREEIYAHVWGWIAFVLIPLIVIGGLADYVRAGDENGEVARVAHRIAGYLIPPLLALYFLILYAYMIRMLVTGELPKNLVSPMVLAAGLLGALALTLFDPRSAARGAQRWLRAVPFLFLPLAPLGAWALVVRIEQYGWTEFRVVRIAVLAAFALLAIAAAVQVLRRRQLALHLAPVVFAAVLVLSAVGPQSALAISRRSQQARLEGGLRQVGIDPAVAAPVVPEDSPRPRREVPAAVYEQIRSSAQYLTLHFGADALPTALREHAEAEDSRWQDFALGLGLRPDQAMDVVAPARGGTLPQNVPLQLDGRIAYRLSWTAERGREQAGRGGVLLVPLDSSRFSVRVGNDVLYADLAGLLTSLPATRGGELPVEHSVVAVADMSGTTRGQLVVWRIWMGTDSIETGVRSLEGLLLLQR